uniref:WAT1-related protein n=2 Tax=Salix viminalis TaxID=40686 RepID=A0A6N2MQW0_SALVM
MSYHAREYSFFIFQIREHLIKNMILTARCNENQIKSNTSISSICTCNGFFQTYQLVKRWIEDSERKPMASTASKNGGFCTRFKPQILMVLAQIGYTFLYFITEASFNHGMNPNVYITYRHIVSGVVMFPFAYFLERKQRPKLTLALFVEIFILSLLGVGLTLNMYFVSMRYTSPTFVASMVNTIASLTFVIAVVLRFLIFEILVG